MKLKDHDTTTRAPCARCGPFTNHRIRAFHDTVELEDVEGELFPIGVVRSFLLECGGCDSVCLRQDGGEDDPSPSYFPPPASRRRPKWLYELPKPFVVLLKEIYTVLGGDGRILATMGARTIVDMVMSDKIGDIGSFEEKLSGLEDRGFIGRVGREYLAAALDAGSAASHRGHVPEAKDVDQVMDIVEHLLQAVYVLPDAGQELKKKTPPRQRIREHGVSSDGLPAPGS